MYRTMTDSTARYGFKIGDLVVVRGWPPSTAMEVIDTSDRALLTLQTPSGTMLKVGRLAVVLLDSAGA